MAGAPAWPEAEKNLGGKLKLGESQIIENYPHRGSETPFRGGMGEGERCGLRKKGHTTAETVKVKTGAHRM